jgi:hypothetical protein
MEFNPERVEEDTLTTCTRAVVSSPLNPCIPNRQKWKSSPRWSPSSRLSRHGPQTSSRRSQWTSVNLGMAKADFLALGYDFQGELLAMSRSVRR